MDKYLKHINCMEKIYEVPMCEFSQIIQGALEAKFKIKLNNVIVEVDCFSAEDEIGVTAMFIEGNITCLCDCSFDFADFETKLKCESSTFLEDKMEFGIETEQILPLLFGEHLIPGEDISLMPLFSSEGNFYKIRVKSN